MILRTITSGVLSAPDGTLLKGVTVRILLVDASSKKACDAWDAISRERIVGEFHLVTNSQARLGDDNGDPILQLWPNDRGTPATMYRISVDYPGVKTFYTAVPSGATPLDWLDLYGLGSALEPATLPLIQQLMDRITALEEAIAGGGVTGGMTYDDGSTITYDDGSPVTGG